MQYEELLKSLKLCRDLELDDYASWIQENVDSSYEYSDHSWEYDAYTMAIEAAKLAYEAGRRDTYSPFWQDDGRSFNDGYKHGYEDAAEDPSAWYVLDANGEKVHIGDKVTAHFAFRGGVREVTSLGKDFIECDGIGLKNDSIYKIVLVTKETFINDLTELLGEFEEEAEERQNVPIISKVWPNGKTARDLAEEIVSTVSELSKD